MTMPEEYAEYEAATVEEETAPVAAPPFTPSKQWSWSPNMLLWAAGGALVIGFGAWFLMTFTAARARALAALEGASNE